MGAKGAGQSLREVDVSSGGKGAWSKDLNKPEPNTIYKVDGNKTYQTVWAALRKSSQIFHWLKMIGIHISNVWQASAASMGTKVDT